MNISMPHRAATWTFYPGFYIKTMFYLAVFYLNYFILVDRDLSRQKPRILNYMLINLLLIIAALTLSHLITNLICETPRPRHWDRLSEWQKIAKMSSYFLRDAVMMILVTGLSVAMRMSTRWSDMELQKQKLLAAQRTIELDNLKSQLNPHFLFNTLNSIYALIDINSENAKEAVHKLSGMLRYMLYEDEHEVPLTQETEFLGNYISLMKMRLRAGDHPLKIDINPDEADKIMVPPLLFIPLVENALKYGTAAASGSPINISITLSADNKKIVCKTVNSFEPKAAELHRGGIGLPNLRRRLLLIYGNRASLRTSVNNNVYTAELILPANIPELLHKSENK